MNTNKIIIALIIFSVFFVVGGVFFGREEYTSSYYDALAQSERRPYIAVSARRHGRTDSIITLTGIEEPSLFISQIDLSGSVDIEVYSADLQTVFDFLLYSGNERKQIHEGKINTDQLESVAVTTHAIEGRDNFEVILPFEERGIYAVRVSHEETSRDVIVIRSMTGAVANEGDGEYIFWGQDIETRRNISEGKVQIYGLKDRVEEQASASFGSDGVASVPYGISADVAIVTREEDVAFVPLNIETNIYDLSPVWGNYGLQETVQRGFAFTDRPLYSPDDTVYFKAVLRNEDDVRYTVPSGKAQVQIFSGWGSDDLVFDEALTISPDGTIDGQYHVPPGAPTGTYYMVIDLLLDSEIWKTYAYFDVQYFRKPEYTLAVNSAKSEYVVHELVSFEIQGEYFFGKPFKGGEVQYKARAGNKTFWEGGVVLDMDGRAVVTLGSVPSGGYTRNIVFEAELLDESGNPSVARSVVLMHAGEYDIKPSETYGRYGSGVVGAEQSVSVRLVQNVDASVADVPLTARVSHASWIPDPDEYKRYVKVEKALPDLHAKTGQDGEAQFHFTPTEPGSYVLLVEGSDRHGNVVKSEFRRWIHETDRPSYTGEREMKLTIHADREEYEPGETARLTITSTIPDRDVFLVFERDRVNRYQVVRMNRHTAIVDAPLVETDMPNIFARVVSFSESWIHGDMVDLDVSAERKRLQISIEPNKKAFGPGEQVSLNIRTTDRDGNPVSAEAAVWAVDKAIFELTPEDKRDPFSTFWFHRWNYTGSSHSLQGIALEGAEGGGCFAEGTQILLPGEQTRVIEDIKVGDTILTRKSEDTTEMTEAIVTDVHVHEVSGYLIINGFLRVTPEHIMYVNERWNTAGSIRTGDTLVDAEGQEIIVDSVEWQRGKFAVYNLEVESYHTFIANGIWVHNGKGGSDPVRSVFEDTAYWNPAVRTGMDGTANITFTLPDNLTTWVVASIGSTIDTMIGRGSEEIVVGKEVVVRPILPNLLRVGDDAVISALVHNFTDTDHVFDATLEWNAGRVASSNSQQVTVASGEMEQVFWRVIPSVPNEDAAFTFRAVSQGDSSVRDAVEQVLPVRRFGFWEHHAETGIGSSEYTVRVSPDSDPAVSKAVLSLTPTLIGTLPTAMKYLITYPYGCTEQIVSTLVPVIVVREHPDMFSEVLGEKDDLEIIQDGVTKLSRMQQKDGGWSWWHRDYSDEFISAYVAEYLVRAKNTGVDVPESVLMRMHQFHKEGLENGDTPEHSVMHAYALSYLNPAYPLPRFNDLFALAPDIAAIAVMANIRGGDQNPETNGLSELRSLAHELGDAVFWESGDTRRFGSRDASTALAVRAAVMGEDWDLAVKGVRYLATSRENRYWSNTFGTARVVDALARFAAARDELDPEYMYEVALNGRAVANGRVAESNTIEEITLPFDILSDQESVLSVTQNGRGHMYSTLLVNEFRTDADAQAVDNGIFVTREYVTEGNNISVGDIVEIRVTVDGNTGEQYLVIEDELPSGMIPVNENFKNTIKEGRDRDYGIGRETTENGMIFSIRSIPKEGQVYTYRAIAITEGVFTAPPASASLMYQPELYGRTAPSQVTVMGDSKVTLAPLDDRSRAKLAVWYFLIPVTVLSVLALGGFGVYASIRARRKINVIRK